VRLQTDANNASPIPADAPRGENLARALWLYGNAPAVPLCNGLGRCGACRVRFSGSGPLPPPLDIEHEVLGAATDEGWRLACRRTAAEAEGFALILPEIAPSPTPAARSKDVGLIRRLAVDLGTSTVHWLGLDADGQIAAGGQAINPQAGAGADIISRLAAAASPHGRRRLSDMAQNLLRRIVAVTAPAGLEEICLAANTAMTAIFMDLPVDGLLAAPYRRPLEGSAAIRLPDLPPVWLPPQPAPFIGGDIAAGMGWALHERPVPFPFLLADLGTNGECVLALDPDTALAASAPLGPALEGMGLACGGAAGPGGVTAFALGPTGLTPRVSGGGAPRFLTGVGVLDLLDTLRRSGLLTAEGCPASPDLLPPLTRRLAKTVERTDTGWRLPLPGGLFLDAADVEAVLKVRAAFVLVVDSLLKRAGIRGADLGGVLLAGSLGEHAPPDILDRLGFLPPGTLAGTKAVGNASLAGAALLLNRPDLRAPLARRCAAWDIVDVTADPDFLERFAGNMRLGA
jgi:uncharacterized 2Fe-2S/4Fe-4S cluster protein (DUF4445 family)/ferredoxin